MVAFVLFLTGVSSVPGLAASTEDESAPPLEEQLVEAVAEEEAAEARAEASREEWLASPQAAGERESSEYAYADLSPAEEEQLLKESFPTLLEQLESDPARLLSHVRLDQVFSQSEAQVTVEGEKMLLESSIPLRVPEGDGDLQKVDLGLEQTGRGYVPSNPVVDLDLPASADEPISVGDSGLEISVAGADADSSARTFGKGDLFLPEALEDSSLLLSPVAGGVDISTLLLSRESPEQLRFAMTLPRDASLRASENGGAEVIGGNGGLLAVVNPPRAVDAQGTEVTATLNVEGESLVVDVPHESLDVAYPILVDPEVVENWSGWSDPTTLGYWKWQWEKVAEKDYIGQTSCIVTCWGNGLYVRSRSNFTYPAGSFGRWWFAAQGTTTYMRRVVLDPMNLDSHGCTANEPHAYTGIWNEGGWWSVLANAYPSGWFSYVDSGEQNLGQGTRLAFVGIGAASSSNIKCGRDYALGGTTLYMDDPESPTIASVTGLPSGWVKGNTQITAKVSANDPGLGVQKIRALGGPAGEWWWDQGSCAGTKKDPCAATRSGQISFNTNGLFEGKGTVNFQPYDPTGKGANSKGYEVWVDRLPPTVDLEGQLAKATDEDGEKEVAAGEGDELSLPTYNLEVEASDATSGAKSIELFLDESKTAEITEVPKCSAGKCSLTYQLKLIGFKAGPHVLRVVAGDQAGNTVERKVEFEYMPATGIKDEYVMQYIPLPDGLDNTEEAESHGPGIAVNVINGNVVYHERDIQEEGRDANLELERSYNSQLPAEKDTRWGHGWSVSQLPELEAQPAEPAPTEASMLRRSGALTSAVSIPTSASQPPTFDAKLHALVEKRSGGGYSVSYEDQGEENVFDSTGELVETTYPSGAALRIDYKGEYKYVTPSYTSAFGSLGTGDGQVNGPGRFAFDSKGNIWLVDKGNNRVEKFNSKGEFLKKFGSFGSGNGQMFLPMAIAIDEKENLWVVDTENSRVQEFSPEGKYLGQFGSEGKANGQLGRPQGIAIDSKGNIWIADTYNSRIQQFSSTGAFIKSFGSFGTGAGQFYNPTGIDVGPGNTIWITDWSNNRITELDASGKVLREFGSKGSGPGQFEHPDAVEVDDGGRVWIADEGNNRIQVFNESGAYISQFGGKGAAPGQFDFSYPIGLAGDGKGHLWISDARNNRIQKWTVGEFTHGDEITGMTVEESDPWSDTDITAEFKTAKGLVEAVDVEGGGESTYGYESGLLETVQNGEGETHYGYDSSNRLNSIELPNGTVASIEYDALSRATAVMVDPAGEEGPKTTKFTYVDEPRETRVSGGGNPEVVYSIGNDGSVFKWSYAKEPPKFIGFGGSLWEHRNSTTALTAGDQSFSATAESAHQIAEVQVLVNGEVAAEEKICEDDPKTSQHECQQVTLEWTTSTANHLGGQLNLEVIATDFLGDSVAERFFVTIPQQPEPEPEAPVEPTFEDTKSFREEFGLDYESGRTESQINQLVWELLEEWKLEKPVARWSAEEWGVPLREAEVKELEYRETYVANDGPAIEAWAALHAPALYGGYEVDQEHGGLIRVGFTEQQSTLVALLKKEAGLEASDQIAEFSSPPANSLNSLANTQTAVISASSNSEALASLVTEVRIDTATSTVVVGASDVPQAKNLLINALGSQIPFTVVYKPEDTEPTAGRYHIKGRIRAGDAIWLGTERRCTASFGAWEWITADPDNKPKRREFMLTAGHCYALGQVVKRAPKVNASSGELTRIGVAKRNALTLKDEYETDAEAVSLDSDNLIPKEVFRNTKPLPVHEPAKVSINDMVCFSGVTSNKVKCGKVLYFNFGHLKGKEYRHGWHLTFVIGKKALPGDSGSPAWNRKTGRAVGIVSARGPDRAYIVPLLQPDVKNVDTSVAAPGALKALEDKDPTFPLKLQVGG